MALRLLIGAAGTGKTQFCMQEIIAAQNRHIGRQILLVPEQFTSQAERDLTLQTQAKGILTAEVLSFGRFAYQVFSRFGMDKTIPLGDVGKQMALQKILLERKEEISYFRHVMDKTGFVEQLGMTLTECFQYCISPERLAQLANHPGLSHAAQEKCREVSLIYQNYLAFLSQDYLTGEESLTLLTEKLRHAEHFQDTELWLDGFYGFTPQEYGVLGQLLRLCSRVTVTLPMDSASYYAPSLPPFAPFYEPHRTKQTLLSLAQTEGIAVESPIFLQTNRRVRSSGLRFLEQNYFYGYHKTSPSSDGLHIASCATKHSEIQYTAGKIISLVRDHGLRYRDIAIVTNAMDVYEKSLAGILQEYGIPCFFDARRNISTHPLMALVQGLLDTLIYDFRYTHVFSYLKSGLTPLSQEDMDVLENYVLAYGIKGYKWKKELWSAGFSADEQAEQNYLNDLRRQVMEPFSPWLSRKRTKSYPLREMVQDLLTQLDTLGVAERLNQQAELLRLSGNVTKAEEHRQVWNLLMQVLEKAVDIFGDLPVSLETFAKILTAGLEKSSMGLIPPTADRLIVGDIARTHLPNIRVLFVLGVNDGILPAPVQSQGVFTDTEREALTQIGVELTANGKRQLFEEQFLIYRCLSKPSDALYLTYANGDTEGKPMFPSSLITRIHRMYPALVVETDPSVPLSDMTPTACFHLLGQQMRTHVSAHPMEPLWQDIYSFFATQPAWHARLDLLKRGFVAKGKETQLSAKTAKLLYGKNILSSVSRLERFASCPFAYFAEYGLKAKERPLYQLHTPDLGNLFHQILEQFSTALSSDGISWQDLDQAQTHRRMELAVDAAAPQLGNEILMDSAANRYLIQRLKRIAKRAGWTLVRHIQSGSFLPSGYEVGFGPHEALPPILIGMKDGSKLILRGKIDRVDMMDAEGKTYVKIIDYKSGNKTFRFQDVYYGLQLQLLLYMDAYLKHLQHSHPDCHPGGVFYFRITDPTVSISSEMTAEQLAELLYGKLQMSGLLLENTAVIQGMDHVFIEEKTGGLSFAASAIVPLKYTKKGVPTAASSLATEAQYRALMDFTVQRAAQIGEQMKAGVILPSPYRRQDMTPCNYCPYTSICRYDYAEHPDYRDLKPIDKETFWAKIIPREKE